MGTQSRRCWSRCGEGAAAGVRVFAGAMTLVFAFAAALQWNDPDGVPWAGFYLLLTAASLGRALDRAWRLFAAASATLAAVLVVSLLPALGGARLEAVTTFRMKSSEDEVVRELGGAALGLLWSLVLLWRRGSVRRDEVIS